ncbi:MAG: PAM68 family protein [Cyanobacteria bacterium P01_H01_bin.130]
MSLPKEKARIRGFNSGDRLPFEPKKSGKGKKAKANAKSSESVSEKADSDPKKPVPRKLNPITTFKNKDKADSKNKGGKGGNKAGDRDKPRGKVYTREEMAIPEVVSNRMLKRMLIFSGVPTFLGFASFIAGYFINVGTDIELPNVVVLLTSLGGLGLGVLGLSYGLVSTSWDEREEGTALGLDEAKVNVGRLIQAWKESRADR